VLISGTALAPSCNCTPMSRCRRRRLNWLVLGRAPGAGEGQETAMLAAAASALFAGRRRTASNILRSLGIDEFGLRPATRAAARCCRAKRLAGTLRRGSSSTAAGDFVAIGKRINDQLHVTFEQALSGSEYFVR